MANALTTTSCICTLKVFYGIDKGYWPAIQTYVNMCAALVFAIYFWQSNRINSQTNCFVRPSHRTQSFNSRADSTHAFVDVCSNKFFQLLIICVAVNSEKHDGAAECVIRVAFQHAGCVRWGLKRGALFSWHWIDQPSWLCSIRIRSDFAQENCRSNIVRQTAIWCTILAQS